jgi:hypothetical protein
VVSDQAQRSPADLQVVLDLRDQEKAWAANVCGLSVALRALMTARHAGVKNVVLVGPQAEAFKSAAKAHPYNNLVISCSAEMPGPADSPRLIFATPLVVSSDAIEDLAKDASPEGLHLPAQSEIKNVDFLVETGDAKERRQAGRTPKSADKQVVRFASPAESLSSIRAS